MRAILLRRIWIRTLLALILLWGLALAAMQWARAGRMTAEKFSASLRATSLEGWPPAERRRRLDRLADQLNRLPLDERRRLRLGGEFGTFFDTLTPEERQRFVERTMPTGLRQMTEAFNRLSREERRQLVERALEDLRREAERVQTGAARAWRENPELVQRLIDEGMKVYLTETTAEAKNDLQPLVEQMQALLRGPMR